MRLATADENPALRDRERPRQTITHTRQSLGAVGRVASRVRTSGKSKLSKANSFMQKPKEDNDDISASPWGVGVAAAPRSEADSVLEDHGRGVGDEGEHDSSPRKQKPDFVDISSPLSADIHSSSPAANASHQQNPGGDEIHRPVMQDRLGNNRKASVRSDRPSGAIGAAMGAAGAARGLVKSVSKFGFRNNDSKSKTQGGGNDLNRAKSTLATGNNDLKKGRSVRSPVHTKSEAEKATIAEGREGIMKSPHPLQRSPSLDGEDDDDLETGQEAKSPKIFGFPGIGRGKIKHDGSSKPKGNAEKSNQDITRSRSKATVEKPKRKSGIARSRSYAPKSDPAGKDAAPGKDSAGNKSYDAKKNRNKKSFKESSPRARKGRASWFGLGLGDQGGDGHMRGSAQVRGKSRTRKQGNTSGTDVRLANGPDLSTPGSLKSPKNLAEVHDFAVDEFFDSEEDDMESGSAPRSMVDDDFITYQTGKGRKGQGNRSRPRV